MAVLVLRVTVSDEGERRDVQILITGVDRLPPYGQVAARHRANAESPEEAVDLVCEWLHRVVPD